MTLKFKLRAPTIISWANRLCKQWDLWITIEGRDIDVMFKDAQNQEVTFSFTQSYYNWRILTQYIDFALLDIQTLQYKNRTLAAAFLYLTLLQKLDIHTAE